MGYIEISHYFEIGWKVYKLFGTKAFFQCRPVVPEIISLPTKGNVI